MNMFTKLLIHEDDRSPGLKKKKKVRHSHWPKRTHKVVEVDNMSTRKHLIT